MMSVGTCKAEPFTSAYLQYTRQGSCAQRAHALGEDIQAGLAIIKAGLRRGSCEGVNNV